MRTEEEFRTKYPRFARIVDVGHDWAYLGPEDYADHVEQAEGLESYLAALPEEGYERMIRAIDAQFQGEDLPDDFPVSEDEDGGVVAVDLWLESLGLDPHSTEAEALYDALPYPPE